MALLVVMAAGVQYTEAANIERFHSWNKPLNPHMASAEEMKAYRADVDAYVKKLNAEIQRLQAMKKQVIGEYDGAIAAYNGDQFFHKGTLPYYAGNTHKKKQHGKHAFRVITNDDGDDEDVTIIVVPK